MENQTRLKMGYSDYPTSDCVFALRLLIRSVHPVSLPPDRHLFYPFRRRFTCLRRDAEISLLQKQLAHYGDESTQ